MPHIPVLLNEVLHYLDPKPGDFIIDGTVNGGGHAKEIIKRITPGGIFLGIDLDKHMIEKTEAMSQPDLNAVFKEGNYAELPQILSQLHKVDLSVPPRASGLLLDLGFSTDQLEFGGRGLSFMKDEPLDMRYNAESNSSLTAAEVVNSWKEEELANLFLVYGEERYGRRIAREIVGTRKKKRIIRTVELVEIIRRAVPVNYERGRINPATRVFQALRIVVNDELRNLESVLSSIREIIEEKGRVVIISFHSLEDRIVKRRFRELSNAGRATVLTKKPILAGEEEVTRNPRSRSAKMRAIRMN